MGRLLFFVNLLLALLLGFAIGVGVGWINGQNNRPVGGPVSAGRMVQ